MSDEKRKEIIKAYAYGYSIEKISEVEGVESKTVKAIVEEAEATGMLKEYEKRGVENEK